MKKHLLTLFGTVLLLCLIGCLTVAAYADGSVAINEKNFPDEVFRQYVKETWDKNSDNLLSADEISAVQSINLSENDTWKNGIASLNGIQYFTNLRYLYAYEMPALRGSVDFSSNTELRSIDMRNLVNGHDVGAVLTGLTLGNLPKLREVQFTNHRFREIDVSGCPAITRLSIGGTNIRELDVSALKNLEKLSCNHTFLSELDVSGNTQLTELNVFNIKVPFTLTLGKQENLRVLSAQNTPVTELNISQCPVLIGLLQDDNYTDQGSYHSYDYLPGINGYHLAYNKTTALNIGDYVPIIVGTFPDEVFRQYVKETWDKNSDNLLSTDEIAAAEFINLSANDTWKNGIVSLAGIQYFTNLHALYADAMPNISGNVDFSNNRELRSIKMSNIVWINGKSQSVDAVLNSVKLGNLPKLTEIQFTNHRFHEIDVSGCPALESVDLSGTNIEELDVSALKNLKVLFCNYTYLSELDVSGNTQLAVLNAFNMKLPFTLTLGNLPNLRNLSLQNNSMEALDISGCPLLLAELKDEYYTDMGNAHKYESVPGNDGNHLWYSKSTLLKTRANQEFSTLTLPAALEKIETEAFAGTAADIVVLPQGCEAVAARAFADCPNLQIVYAPANAVIDAQAFAGCGHVYVSRAN